MKKQTRRSFPINFKVEVAEKVLTNEVSPENVTDENGEDVGSILVRRWVTDYQKGKFDKVMDASRARIRFSNILPKKEAKEFEYKEIPAKPKQVAVEQSKPQMSRYDIKETVKMLKVRLADVLLRNEELKLELDAVRRNPNARKVINNIEQSLSG